MIILKLRTCFLSVVDTILFTVEIHNLLTRELVIKSIHTPKNDQMQHVKLVKILSMK